MKYRLTLYFWLMLVGGVSFVGTLYLPISEVSRTLTALPFVGALFAALFQLIRDHTSFERDRLKQEREHAFTVAAASHMSKVAFDKHVEFCELYLKALQELLGNLLASGPTKKAVEHLRPLYEVRRNYRLWTSPSMTTKLDEFESKVSKMGGALGVWEAQSKAKRYEPGKGDEHLDKAYEFFSEIMNMKGDERDDADAESKKSRGYALVIEHLQEVVGIEALTTLRDKVLQSAARQE